jgi:hypothetical protein
MYSFPESKPLNATVQSNDIHSLDIESKLTLNSGTFNALEKKVQLQWYAQYTSCETRFLGLKFEPCA